MPHKRTLQISDEQMEGLNLIRDKIDKPVTKIISTAIQLYLEMVDQIGFTEIYYISKDRNVDDFINPAIAEVINLLDEIVVRTEESKIESPDVVYIIGNRVKS